jgi:hypothetical protein
MLSQLGRGMQILGLIVLPAAMFLELNNSLGRSFGLSQMLIMLVFGMALFMVGRLIEGHSRGKPD